MNLAPTLAVLLGVTIPSRNLGILLDVVEPFVENSYQFLSIWRNNVRQLMDLYADIAGSADFRTGRYEQIKEYSFSFIKFIFCRIFVI